MTCRNTVANCLWQLSALWLDCAQTPLFPTDSEKLYDKLSSMLRALAIRAWAKFQRNEVRRNLAILRLNSPLDQVLIYVQTILLYNVLIKYFADPTSQEPSSQQVVQNFLNNQQNQFNEQIAGADGAPTNVTISGTFRNIIWFDDFNTERNLDSNSKLDLTPLRFKRYLRQVSCEFNRRCLYWPTAGQSSTSNIAFGPRSPVWTAGFSSE